MTAIDKWLDEQPQDSTEAQAFAQWVAERKPLTGDNPLYLSEAFMQDRWFLGTPPEIAAKMIEWLPRFSLKHFIFQGRQPGMTLRHAVDSLEALEKAKQSEGIARFVERLFPHIAHSTYIAPVCDVWLADGRGVESAGLDR